MSIKCAYIDFEYNNSQAKKLNLVCCSMFLSDTKETVSYWLHNDSNKQNELREKLMELNFDNYIFVAHYVAAEAHAFISLDLDPLNFKWIDTRTEYRCILNQSKWMYGQHLIGGRVVRTQRPDFYETEKVNNSKPETNLASMVFKLCDVEIDTEHKDQMRDLIISAPDKFTAREQKDITDYCISDVTYLEKCLSGIVDKYRKLLSAKPKVANTLLEEMLLRGKFGANTAIMYSLGYPINYEATVNFSESVEDILSDIARDIRKQFPDNKPFRYDPKDKRFKMNTKVIRDWIGKSGHKYWGRTPTKLYSLSLDAFEKFYKFSHNYPRNKYGAQIVRYLKTKQSMNGFRKSLDGKKSFWDSVGPDKRCRAFLNPFGAATSRSQPAATSFIPLKSSWMRALIMPDPGKAIVAIDYGSEEFLIAALASGDGKMIDAYRSGDVYMYYGKEIGMIPKDGKKEDYSVERQVCKGVVLGIGYGLTKVGLSRKLTMEIGSEWDEEKAQELIDSYNDLFVKYYNWKEEEYDNYKTYGFLKLPCGWYQFGQNTNSRSVKNFLTQGFGASIMRKAVELGHEEGLDIIFTLHDALYIETDAFDYKIIDVFRDVMKRAFIHYFPEHRKKDAALIRLDIETWGPEYEDSIVEGKRKCTVVYTPEGYEVEQERVHIDPRTVDAYLEFKKYFNREKFWEVL